MKEIKTVGFVGLGKLGLPVACVMSNHYIVNGYDIILPGFTPTFNPNLNVATLEDTVQDADIIFIAVPTPHDPSYDGSIPSCQLEPKDFEYTILKDCLRDINKLARPEQLVVLISTVLPGTIRRELIDCIPTPRFIYNPYLIAMGTVEHDFCNPEMVIIGTEDGRMTADAEELIHFYKSIIGEEARYVVGTWDEAESVKIFYNTWISTKIGLVNMIQDVAMKNGNINVDVVTDALKESDLRITGPKYMTAGMGDAGPCHPRDNIALRWMAQELDLGYDLFEGIMSAREMQAKNMAIKLAELARENDFPVYIHGKAYKPDIQLVDGSYSLLVGYYLEELGITPTYIDPMVKGCHPLSEPVIGIVLLAHNRSVTYNYTINSLIEPHELEAAAKESCIPAAGNIEAAGEAQPFYCEILPGSTIVDPWRTFPKHHVDYTVIHYGNTRGN